MGMVRGNSGWKLTGIEGFLPFRLWLMVPVSALITTDALLTLMGQPASYWGGDLSQAVEANPLARAFLAVHPAAFSVLVLAWMVLACALVVLWHHPVANGLAVAIALAHALGSATWLVSGSIVSWMVVLAFLGLATEGSVWCWKQYALGREQWGGSPRGAGHAR